MKNYRTFVQELRTVESNIVNTIGTAMHKLHCLHSGVTADALNKEQILADLQEVQKLLAQISD